MTQLAIGQPGFWQLVIVLAIFLLFFGSGRLPKMARSLGASLTEFKKGLRGETDDEEDKPKLEGGEDKTDKTDTTDKTGDAAGATEEKKAE